jgi:hypothetical protein
VQRGAGASSSPLHNHVVPLESAPSVNDDADKVAVARTLNSMYLQLQLNASITKFTIYALAAAAFLALQIALIVINSQSDEVLERLDAPFHFTEFWAIFVFSMLEAFLLSTAATSAVAAAALNGSVGARDSRWATNLYFASMGGTIILTLVGALLVSFDLELFEEPAHLVEYVAQVPLTLLDIIFVVLQIRAGEANSKTNVALLAVAVLLSIASVVQLVVYCGALDLGISAERAAHFFEFTIEGLNAAFAVRFAMQTRAQLHQKCAFVHV